MPELTREEIQRVHDLVRTSLRTVEWIVAADESGEPPDKLLVRGLVESVLDDPGESPLIAELFTAVADTREDVGLPVGLPSPNWHTAAGEIVARVCAAILTPGGTASGVLGPSIANERTVIHVDKLAQCWPDIAAQLHPFATVRFSRLIDLLTQEYNRGAAEFAKSINRVPVESRFGIAKMPPADLLEFKTAQLARRLGIAPDTLGKLANRAGVDRPERGDREFIYKGENLKQLLFWLATNAGKNTTKEAAKKLLDELDRPIDRETSV